MKKVYVILSYTGTLLSRIIKGYTKNEFSHVSIALDLELNEMYSFGRLNPYNPFWGGFVHEYIDKGTFKRFYKTIAKVYSLEVSDEQYQKIKQNILQIQKLRKEYKFNILGLFAVGFHKKIRGEKSFYCAEFVKYVMEEAGVNTGLPDIVKPEDFKQINGLETIYVGLLKMYEPPKIKASEFIIN